MTNKQINTINGYFNTKHMDRKQLESVLDFDNLTMDEKYIPEIMELLKSGYNEDEENIIRSYVLFVKNRSDSGDIAWEVFVSKLNELELENSALGIRVQKISESAYWEVFFNHFDLTYYENGEVKLTFNQEWYEESEQENAYAFLAEQDININSKESNVITKIAERWEVFSQEEKDSIISALDAIYSTHYVNKSRVDITKKSVKSITMSKADLTPEAGIRDYRIEFTDGDYIGLRF